MWEIMDLEDMRTREESSCGYIPSRCHNQQRSWYSYQRGACSHRNCSCEKFYQLYLATAIESPPQSRLPGVLYLRGATARPLGGPFCVATSSLFAPCLLLCSSSSASNSIPRTETMPMTKQKRAERQAKPQSAVNLLNEIPPHRRAGRALARATFWCHAKGKSGFEQKRMSMCASKEEALACTVRVAWRLAMETF